VKTQIFSSLEKRINQFPIPLLIKDEDQLNVMPLRNFGILFRYYITNKLANDAQIACAKVMIDKVYDLYRHIYDADPTGPSDSRLIALVNLMSPSRFDIQRAASSIKDYIVKHYGNENESKMTDAYQIVKQNSFQVDLLIASHSKDNLHIVNEIAKRLSIIDHSISVGWKKKNTNFILSMQYYDVPLLRQFKFVNGILVSNTAGSTSINHEAGINNMYIWRGGEEMIKLLTHEGVHLFDGQVSNGIKDDEWANRAHLDFCIGEKGYLVDEGRTEGLACLMNSIIIASELSDKFESEIVEMWSIEKLFGLYQVAKLLYLAGFNSFRQFCSPSTETLRLLDGGTSIEYFIFKSLVIYNLEQFMLALKLNDGVMYDLIMTTKESSPFEKLIDVLINKIKNQDKESILFKTGRQTILEKEIGIAVDYNAYV
jgi:hypothetical protein